MDIGKDGVADIFRFGTKLELLGLGRHDSRVDLVVAPDVDEPAVLWIDVKHQIVADLQRSTFCLAESGKRQSDIILAPKRIETNSAGFEVAWRAGRPDRDFVEEETGNLMLVAMQLVPVDLTAAIGAGAKGVVEKSEVEVANGEFKLTRDLVAGKNRVEVAVARLMGQGKRGPNKQGDEQYSCGDIAP